MRAACRHSSNRCVDTRVLATSVIANARTRVTVLLTRKACSVVVCGVPIDRMDVIDAPLRRVLDDERWSLDAEVRGAALGRRAAPRKIGLWKLGADLVYPRRSERIVRDPRPLAHDVHEHRLLRRRQRRCPQ